MRHVDLGCAAGGNVTNGGSAVTAWPDALSEVLFGDHGVTSGIEPGPR